MKDYLYLNDDEDQYHFKVSKTSKVEQLMVESEFSQALDLIDEILENDFNFENLVLKGRILDKLSRYSDAVDCFNKALSLNDSNHVKEILSNTLYNWAKVTYFPDCDFKKALELVDNAISINIDGDLSEFYFLKAEILESSGDVCESRRHYLKAHGDVDKLKEFESQIEYLNNTSDCLICISGSYFYNFTIKSGMIVSLVKEDDNEYDSDAIAVYFENEKVGYVANSDNTLIDSVNSASLIKNRLSKDSSAEILFVYLDEYIIAKLL